MPVIGSVYAELAVSTQQWASLLVVLIHIKLVRLS